MKHQLFPFQNNSLYEQCNWDKYPDCDINTEMSFIIPISVTSESNGIYIFDTKKEMTKNKAVKCKKQKYIYNLGEIIMYNSKYWSIRSIYNKCEEPIIILHGNIIKCSGKWIIY